MSDSKNKFSVYSWTIVTSKTPMYCHWKTGLKMSITKNGVNIILDSEEIQELVNSIPRTVGGSY